MFPSVSLPAASKIHVENILRFSINPSQCFGGHKVPKSATLPSLLCTWSIPESKTQTGFIRATKRWQNTFSLKINVNGLQTRVGILCFATKLLMLLKPVLEFSFLFFVCLLQPPLRSYPFLIYKQLLRKEVFPVAAWNITNCSQSSTQWVHSCRTSSIEVYFGVFDSKLNSDSSDERDIILKQNLDVLGQKYIETSLKMEKL